MRRSSTPGPRRRTMIVAAAAAVALFGSVLPVHAAPGDAVPPGIAAKGVESTYDGVPGKGYGAVNALGGPVAPQPGEGEVGGEQWVWVRPR